MERILGHYGERNDEDRQICTVAGDALSDWDEIGHQLERAADEFNISGGSRGSRRTPKENFNEFLRKFERKYETVIESEATLIDILADDYFAGRAKNIFTSAKDGKGAGILCGDE
ncbi:unnamed protein product [Nippostrongylus brasiliensis]|uniref:Transposase n=1 Tax=Nippostrongylus brasiliensis TaxID=27835 RepID=A0A0N4YQ18_NIPBR|nr:unnamed protein product [Nippostrongylus brasiliensis]